VTPAQAISDGASILVIGRPISRAEDPVAAVRAIEATL
jgi:orotidine-5'-phosphate decarboxylase